MYRVIKGDMYFDKNGKVDIDYYKNRKGNQSTRLGKGRADRNPPYIAKDKLLNGHKVYSVYAFTGDKYVDIFKAIKHGNIEESTYNEWVDYTAQYIIEEILDPNQTDVICVPKSSSTLAYDIARVISRKTGILCLNNAFIKNPVDQIKLQFPAKISQTAVDECNNILNKIVEKGIFEAKAVPKRFLKFFRNIYRNDDQYNNLLEDQNVLVVDDSMTSKSTMMNIFDVCDNIYHTASCYGVTAFKKTGSR